MTQRRTKGEGGLPSRTANPSCEVEGCSGARYVRGWCTKHYQRWRTHGDPAFEWRRPPESPNPELVGREGVRAVDMPVRAGYESVAAHILSMCEMADEGCWFWTGGLDPAGYGRRKPRPADAYVSYLVHRALYAALVETPTPGMHLDHMCRRRACCNPAHLDLVAPQVNLTRGLGPVAERARARTCIRGHAFDDANTYFNKKSGTRMCRKCNALRQRQTKARRLARIAATQSGHADEPR